jgi:hypothetical protein
MNLSRRGFFARGIASLVPWFSRQTVSAAKRMIGKPEALRYEYTLPDHKLRLVRTFVYDIQRRWVTVTDLN